MTPDQREGKKCVARFEKVFFINGDVNQSFYSSLAENLLRSIHKNFDNRTSCAINPTVCFTDLD